MPFEAIELTWPGKQTPEELLGPYLNCPPASETPEAPNLLIKGENAAAMRRLLDSGYAGRITLAYLDPPFATNQVFRAGTNGARTISSALDEETAYADTLTGPAFLAFLRERLFLLRELLAEDGSVYLHIDYKIGHYVKAVMDEVFGAKNFRNDIARIKCNPKNFSRKAYGNIKDLILFYSKGKNPVWNDPREPYTEEDLRQLFPKRTADGRRYTTIPLHAPGETQNGATGKPFRGIAPPKGRHWRADVAELEKWDDEGRIEWSKNGVPRKIIFPEEREGKKRQDVWRFKDPQYPGYPTEKNAELLRLIVAASSRPGDLVLDCFCGSGTTLAAARDLERRFIGVDASDKAIAAAQKKLDSETPGLFANGQNTIVEEWSD